MIRINLWLFVLCLLLSVSSSEIQGAYSKECLRNVNPLSVQGEKSVLSGLFGLNQIEQVARDESDTLVIEDSLGGYLETMEYIVKKYKTLEIIGEQCVSACAYAAVIHHNVHISKGLSVLQFHSVMILYLDTCARVFDPIMTKVYLDNLPGPLRNRLQPLTESEQIISLTIEEVESLTGTKFERI